MTSVVSIMVPCYEAAETLPMALGSVLAQTWADWECICVDDGSRDATWPLLEHARRVDSRFRIERFATNRGRGAARQRCLELARGDYLAFLDADDWLYPQKIERQARVLDERADVPLVGSAALVTDGSERPVGVMRRGEEDGRALSIREFPRPEPPQIVFPTVLARLDLARAAGFDPAFRRSQDSDFLIRLLLGRRYAVLDEALYAYSQGTAASLEKTVEGYWYRMRSHLRHVGSHPIRVARTVAATGAKMALYRAAGLVGAHEFLIRRRWQEARPADLAAFEVARAAVEPKRELLRR